MGNGKYVGIVSIDEELKSDGNWVVKSNDLPGLLLWGKDIRALREDIPLAIQTLYRLNFELEVQVSMAGSPVAANKACAPKPHRHTNWAAVPTAIAV